MQRDYSKMRLSTNVIAIILKFLILVKVCFAKGLNGTMGFNSATGFNDTNANESTNRGCNFLNRTIEDGHSTHIGFGEMPYCMTCSCLLRKLECTSIEVSQKVSKCISEQQCKSMSTHVKDTCERNAAVNCHNQPPENSTWMANGCEYSCDGKLLKHRIIHRPWCQTISKHTRCAVCPDKNEFFKKYGSKITMCKNYPEAVHRENICDGRKDCVDRTDEENCTAYYCTSDITEVKLTKYIWSRTMVGATRKLECKHIFPHYNGTLHRQCKFDASNGTFWTKVDLYNCTDLRPDPFNITELSNASMEYLSRIANRLLDFCQSDITMKRCIELAILVTEKVIESGLVTKFLGYFVYTPGHPTESVIKTLIMVMNHGLWCDEEMVSPIRITLREKLKQVYHLDYRLQPGRYCGLGRIYSSSNDDLFVPELLFRKPSTMLSKGVRPKLLQAPGLNLEKLETRHNKANNRSIVNASNVYTNKSSSHNRTKEWGNHSSPVNNLLNNDQKVKKKASIHVKIIFGFDAFMSIVSLLSLLVALFFLFSLSLPKSTKWFIRKNLFLAVSISFTIYVVSIWAEFKMIQYRWLCTTFVILNYYAILAMYSWMTVEGINLIIHTVLVFKRKSTSHGKFAAIGWGLPLIPLGICLAVRTTPFMETKGCTGLGKHSWMFKGPAAVYIAVNTVMYTVICCSLLKNARSSRKMQVSVNQTRSSVKPFLTLLPLLGLTYLLGFTFDASIVMKYIYVLFNDGLGLVLTVVTFFMDSQVKESLKKAKRITKPADANEMKKYVKKAEKSAQPANTSDVKKCLKNLNENAMATSSNATSASTNATSASTTAVILLHSASSKLSIIEATPNGNCKEALETKM